jgi:hypothetical protein
MQRATSLIVGFLASCTVQYSTVQYSKVQYSKVQYSTVQYSTVQYSTVQYSTVQYIHRLDVNVNLKCRIAVSQAEFSKKQFVFPQPTGLKFKEETRKLLNLQHHCVRR